MFVRIGSKGRQLRKPTFILKSYNPLQFPSLVFVGTSTDPSGRLVELGHGGNQERSPSTGRLWQSGSDQIGDWWTSDQLPAWELSWNGWLMPFLSLRFLDGSRSFLFLLDLCESTNAVLLGNKKAILYMHQLLLSNLIQDNRKEPFWKPMSPAVFIAWCCWG